MIYRIENVVPNHPHVKALVKTRDRFLTVVFSPQVSEAIDRKT